MLKANKIIGIVYSDNSKKYVEDLKKIIAEKGSKGHCIETIVIDDSLLDSKRAIDKRVFNNLDKCDFGFVFLTKDIETKEGTFISKPNVLLEWGYLRGRLDEEHVWCVIDFPHEEIDNKKYILPSDYISEYMEKIDENNSLLDLQHLVDKLLKIHKITKLDNYDGNDLIGSLVLNSNYRTDFEALFTEDKLMQINHYSLKYQQEEILKIWIKEKEKLSDGGQIIYLFERMVFLPFFPEKVIRGKLMDFYLLKIKIEMNMYLCAGSF